MRVETEQDRRAAADTLREVTRKLEEALRLSQQLEHERDAERACECAGANRG